MFSLIPPFGDNLPYAELNFLWEAWLRVFTNAAQDAVVSRTQGKDLPVYTAMMASCLKETYRLLKPGRWVTNRVSQFKECRLDGHPGSSGSSWVYHR